MAMVVSEKRSGRRFESDKTIYGFLFQPKSPVSFLRSPTINCSPIINRSFRPLI